MKSITAFGSPTILTHTQMGMTHEKCNFPLVFFPHVCPFKVTITLNRQPETDAWNFNKRACLGEVLCSLQSGCFLQTLAYHSGRLAIHHPEIRDPQERELHGRQSPFVRSLCPDSWIALAKNGTSGSLSWSKMHPPTPSAKASI